MTIALQHALSTYYADWKRPPSSVIVKNAISSIRPGGVVLCHDIHPGTVAAIPPLIDGLRADGYSFATVSELIKAQESQYQQNQSSKQKRHLRGTAE
jgi:peptidoglycan/xylan/chitin deacetylase (PgdA/CDA1 family)